MRPNLRTDVAFAIKAEVVDSRAKTFRFIMQKSLYGGKLVVKGDMIFVFAIENEGRAPVNSHTK